MMIILSLLWCWILPFESFYPVVSVIPVLVFVLHHLRYKTFLYLSVCLSGFLPLFVHLQSHHGIPSPFRHMRNHFTGFNPSSFSHVRWLTYVQMYRYCSTTFTDYIPPIMCFALTANVLSLTFFVKMSALLYSPFTFFISTIPASTCSLT